MQIKYLNVGPEMVKLLHGKIGNALVHLGIGNNFMNQNLIAQQLIQRIGKWDYVKLKSFYTERKQNTKLKRQPGDWKKTFASLITRKYRELKN
jgi:hypothetical protein